MSPAEQAPTPAHVIPGIQEQQSVVSISESQVAQQGELAEQERVAMLRNGAFNDAANKMEKQAAEGNPDRAQLEKDADTLRHSAIDERNVGFDARQQMTRNNQWHKAHVRENLPAYIEAATQLANEDLQKRIGQEVIVHTKDNPYEGIQPVELVNPALKNEDVAQIKTTDQT